MSKKDRAALVAQVSGIEAQATELRVEFQDKEREHEREHGRFMTRLAVLVHSGALVKEALGQDWRKWAVDLCKGFGRPLPDGSFSNVSAPTVYRLRNAGTVAEVIGADKVGEAAYTALVPLYRILATAKTDAQVEKAKTAVVAKWDAAAAKSRGSVPTESEVSKLVPKGTRGAGKGTTGRKRNTPTATTENGGDGNAVTVTIDPAAVEAAAKIVKTQMTKWVRAGQDEAQAREHMSFAWRMINEHGKDTIGAVLAAPVK